MRNALRATFAKPQTVTPNANKRKWLDLGSDQGKDTIASTRLGFRDRNWPLKRLLVFFTFASPKKSNMNLRFNQPIHHFNQKI